MTDGRISYTDLVDRAVRRLREHPSYAQIGVPLIPLVAEIVGVVAAELETEYRRTAERLLRQRDEEIETYQQRLIELLARGASAGTEDASDAAATPE